jgi:hypothetical protein
MPPSLTSGSSIIVSVQNTDVDIGLRHGPKGSALPIIPQSVSRGARFSRLRWFATATACQVAGPPCTDLTGLPATGGFYFQAFDGSVTLPVAGYDYNSVWTPLLAGLSPAGMAASLAALVQRVQSDAAWQFAKQCVGLVSRSALVFTQANASWLLKKLAALLSTSVLVSPHLPNQGKCSFRQQCATSWLGQGCNSRKGAFIPSKACRGPGRFMPWRAIGGFDVRFQSEADIDDRLASISSVADNPEQS